MAGIIHHDCAYTIGLRDLDFCKPFQKGLLDEDAFPATVTLGNIIGWIPIIGAIIGTVRIIAGAMMYRAQMAKNASLRDQDTIDMGIGFIGRGIAEILCMGPLLLLADIIFTVARCCIPEPTV